jgi:hypothetical protein
MSRSMLLALAMLANVANAQDIEGDVALMKVLQDAQRANESSYPHGEMRAIAESGAIGEQNPRMSSTVYVRWNQRSSRVLASQVLSLPEQARERVKRDEELLEIEFIDDDKRLIAYFPGSNLIRISSRMSASPGHLTSLRPDQVWYRMDFRGPSWISLLGPHPNVSQDEVISYAFRQVNHDRVEMYRRAKPDFWLKAVASLGWDGNIVEYENYYHDQRAAHHDTGVYRWKRDHAGRVYLESKDIRYSRTDKTGKKFPDGYVRLKVLEFNPDIVPPPSLFELSSLPLAPGTRVEDEITGRRYRIGDAPESKITDSFDDLIGEMRGRGFARPSR